ncbi:hypothetical protein GCM10023310_29300 [Paenibacillus vulneris]|uniref:Uncharacterized protein n=1 Tax=Paenibacillus vulneris TaxID=1133364 RepID=A0ABW3UT80_9BACL
MRTNKSKMPGILELTGSCSECIESWSQMDSERLLWGKGDGSTLTVVTPFGKIGGLIFWYFMELPFTIFV